MAENIKVKGVMKGPRWKGIQTIVRNAAFINNLEVVSLEVETSWFTETVRFEFMGDDADIVVAIVKLKTIKGDYNG